MKFDSKNQALKKKNDSNHSNVKDAEEVWPSAKLLKCPGVVSKVEIVTDSMHCFLISE
jgi:hypothetical protein